jgi:hypothetical protein
MYLVFYIFYCEYRYTDIPFYLSISELQVATIVKKISNTFFSWLSKKGINIINKRICKKNTNEFQFWYFV